MSKIIKGGSGGFVGEPSGFQGNRPSSVAFPPPKRNVLSQEDQRYKEEAKSIVAEAQQQAQMIIQQAEEFRQKGYEDGLVAGQEKGSEEWLKKLLDLNAQHEKVLKYFEPKLVELSIKIAEKIIGYKMSVEPDMIVDIVAKALHAVRHQREIFIRVNPEDFDVIAQNKPVLLEQLSKAQDIDIRSDPSIDRGGCRIESGIGLIDATLERQLRTIEKLLLGD